MSTTIERPEGTDALNEFIAFQDKINEQRGAYWPAIVDMALPFLEGEGPEAVGREIQPFVVRRNGEIAARVLAMVDRHYLDHWDDGVGHLAMFEALPDSTDDVRALMNEACGWLRERGLVAARAGFGHNDFPFAFGDPDTLPPIIMRQNPGYYHTVLKEAGFQSEQAWVDYRIEVTPPLIERWTSCVDALDRGGFRLVPFGEIPADVRTQHWITTWNEAFARHWGVSPQTAEEHEAMASFLGPFGMAETSVMVYEEAEPVGALWVVPEFASMLAAHTRELLPHEQLNFLAIAVRERARGKGVNMAMAAYAYLELARRGATHVSYTLVLDDNWPSRRTAEKLGAEICGNYMTYRRNFPTAFATR